MKTLALNAIEDIREKKSDEQIQFKAKVYPFSEAGHLQQWHNNSKRECMHNYARTNICRRKGDAQEMNDCLFKSHLHMSRYADAHFFLSTTSLILLCCNEK